MTKNAIENTEEIVLGEFDFESFSKKSLQNRKKSPEYQQMLNMYNINEILSPEKGNIVSAKYVGKSERQFIFNVKGYKDDVRVDDRLSESKYLKNMNIGDIIDLLIIDVNNNNYSIKGSVASLYESRAHANLKSLEEGSSVTVVIKGLSPAGYDVDLINGCVTLPGFMPNTLAGINKLHDPESLIGKTLDVMIESYSQNEGTYIVSRRKYLQTLIPEAIKKLKYDIPYTGHVTGTTPFGIFVEFNECLTGMIHKANINPDWIDRISDIQPGFGIEFFIKEIIKDKIILTQILRETLWDNIKNGQIIEGTIKDVKAFGTLVNLDDETVGLIHTSEMEKLNRKFTAGQNVKVKVLSVDRLSRKIFLTTI